MNPHVTKRNKQIRQLDRALAPTNTRMFAMIREIERVIGQDASKLLMERKIPQKRLVFFVHSYLLAPHLIRSRFDLLTWGRFAVPPVAGEEREPTADDWEI